MSGTEALVLSPPILTLFPFHRSLLTHVSHIMYIVSGGGEVAVVAGST